VPEKFGADCATEMGRYEFATCPLNFDLLSQQHCPLISNKSNNGSPSGPPSDGRVARLNSDTKQILRTSIGNTNNYAVTYCALQIQSNRASRQILNPSDTH
jgi:hypothetical protein